MITSPEEFSFSQDSKRPSFNNKNEESHSTDMPDTNINPTDIDPFQFVRPERIKKLERVLSLRQPSLTIVLENIHDEHNVSAIFRSCDSVGVLDIHLVYTGHQRFPRLGKKTSAGTFKWVYQHHHTTIDECYDYLRKKGMTIYTTKLGESTESLYTKDLTKPVAIVFGNEHAGVSLRAVELSDANIIIPQQGFAQSLNISVACAVSLFEAMRQRMAAGMYNSTSLEENQYSTLLKEWTRKSSSLGRKDSYNEIE